MRENEELNIELTTGDQTDSGIYDLDRVLYDLDSQISLLSSQADQLDYLISIASGLLCGALDILWAGDFDLTQGRALAGQEIERFVVKAAKLLGYQGEAEISSAVRFLKKKFPLPSDGNTPDFGGGLQHHLRDFAHHPTPVGMLFSLLTQFTGKCYGTDKSGKFLIVDAAEKSKDFIGGSGPEKLWNGVVVWFFHLVSDMAGSSGSAGKSGGTGIPGPILSLAKEMSALPIFQQMKINNMPPTQFLSKLFNGTLLAQKDESGAIIRDSVLRFDLRGELGAASELKRQTLPVALNDCMVRAFYCIRRFAMELKDKQIHSLGDWSRIDWAKIEPANHPTIARMLTIATGVFATVDIGEAVISQKYWVSVNYAGVGRFAVAVGQDISWYLRGRNIKQIKEMYQKIKRLTYTKEDQNIYERVGKGMEIDKFGLTAEQTEILYNLEYHKTLNDVQRTKTPMLNGAIRLLKQEWMKEWQTYMEGGFSQFLQAEGAKLHWYSEEELIQAIERNDPNGLWFRLALLEAMLFEPYYPLGVEKDKKGVETPSKKYKDLQNPLWGYKEGAGDDYLESVFASKFCLDGVVERFRKCYGKALRELNEVLKTALVSLTAGAATVIIAVFAAGAFAPAIAVSLVGSNFAGLSGAALTNACLAYLGGGAIAAGGLGMAGGTMAIVGGGAVLGMTAGAGVGGVVGAAALSGKKNTVLQSAKLPVSVREILLNDEKDLEYSNTVYEQYVQNIVEIEKGLVELRLQADMEGDGKKKKEIKEKIKRAEESVEAMKIARKSMAKFISSFQTGVTQA